MSASDAAPLPRLGEVFFDVRGNSRSMRLSWYADTDVAVFSIWQGGMCTGTFRLPMGDLDRMIEILQRGPGGHGAGEHGGRGYGDSGYDADYQADYNGEYGADQYGRPGRSTEGYRAGYYGRGEYGEPDYGEPDYGDAGPRRGPGTGGHRAERFEKAGERAYSRDDSRYQADVTGQRSVPDDASGYGQERFVPPYVRSRGDSSEDGYLDDSEYRLPADPTPRSRHSAGRHGGGQSQ